ncbi:hypothetical protein B4109_3055 [Geobacillus stearothermophilus]|jgi:hypothetical protein|uniref:Uncharacterized protein n=1 Tax=Geobacillus stearothermophilus TaxID=1422 RepID=A0A150MVG8_GEOSE|nr:hypothetical protein B4109_3055 [Geobacillus stearothermophilus]
MFPNKRSGVKKEKDIQNEPVPAIMSIEKRTNIGEKRS